MKQLVTKFIGIFLNITAPLVPKWNADYAFELLCKVRRSPISSRGKEFLASAETQYLDIDGQSAALHRWGTGATAILFLHGWMSNSQRWQPYIERLDLTKFSVYAIDAPGHGMAKGNKLHVEAYRKSVTQAISIIGEVHTLISHSLGGLVVSYGYLHNPDLPVKKFVLMGSPSGMDAIFSYFQQLLGLTKKAIHNLEQKANSILKISHQDIAVRNFFKKVEKPVLVIHDKGDVITPFQPIQRALQNNTHIETMFTEGLKHDLKSEEVYTRVIDFIKSDRVAIKRNYSA